MTFYLKPPRGLLNLHQLEECVKQRLICYNNIDSTTNDGQEYNFHDYEYLVEDSALDRAGHFLLRLASHCDNAFRHKFLQNEQKLLETRLNSYDIQDVKHFLKRMMKHSVDNLKDCNDELLNDLHVVIIDVSSSMLRKGYLRHVFEGDHKYNCEQYVLRVPFQHCPSLIRTREVNLSGGSAEITCGLWKQFFLSLFNTYLMTALKAMAYSRSVDKTLSDIRIQHLLKELNFNSLKYYHKMEDKDKKFDISHIKEEARLFPLCMLHLYKILEKTNRLPHNERFDFSLYMKGIGVSMSDSLKFWEQIYSKKHTSCSRCTHDWKQNEKRYIYGIRHLYGFEGSRRNYQSRSCQYLQEKILGPTEDGGCPFKNFDNYNLRKVLKTLLPRNPDEVEVIIYERNKDPSASCKLFYNIVLKQTTNKDIVKEITVATPVQYYLTLKREIEREMKR